MSIDKLQTETARALQSAVKAGKITKRQAASPAFIRKVVKSAVRQIAAGIRQKQPFGPSLFDMGTGAPPEPQTAEFITYDLTKGEIIDLSSPQTLDRNSMLWARFGFRDHPTIEQLLNDGWQPVHTEGHIVHLRRPLATQETTP